ncbi:MAG: RluA family pseudouridine synthase [Synergistaceae bacterium]|nr:RluA family pseudouridine synthase [Synergistaceae bacterium]
MNVELIGDSAPGERLDVFLSRSLGITRSFAQRLVKEGRVAGGAALTPLKPSSRVQSGMSYSVALPEPEGMEIEPEPVDFGVVYEDEDLMIIDKPAGLVVHPAPGHWRGTLVHGLLWRYPEMRGLRNRLRPGIVHRLDATTSGLMVVARRQPVMEELQRMFQERRVMKQYLALVHGTPARREGTLSGPIARDPDNPLRMAVLDGGRPALTGYRVLWSRGGASLVVWSLFPGRTHQIRVHMAALGHPLFGDTLYGAPKTDGLTDRVFLHSWRLAFAHPVTGAELSFRLPLPEELRGF